MNGGKNSRLVIGVTAKGRRIFAEELPTQSGKHVIDFSPGQEAMVRLPRWWERRRLKISRDVPVLVVDRGAGQARELYPAHLVALLSTTAKR